MKARQWFKRAGERQAMINQLDETIRNLVLKHGNFDTDSVTVSFDQPTGD